MTSEQQPESAVGGADHKDQNGVARAYREVRAAIMDGRLPPGEVFSQVQVAAQLGVSRTPLREALRLLQTEGLVESEERRRVRVSALKPLDLDALYAMRILVESLGVSVTVPLLDDGDLSRIGVAHDEIVQGIELRSYEATREPHRHFHFGLFQHADERLRRSIVDLWDQAERYRTVYVTSAEDRLAMSMLAASEHRAILDAAGQHDSTQCARLIARHLSRTALTLFASHGQGQEPVSIRHALLLVGASVGAGAPPKAHKARAKPDSAASSK